MLPILTGQSVSVLKAIDEDEDATLSSIYDRLKETRSWIKGACAIGEAEDLDKIIRKETKSLLASSVSTDAEASEAIAKCLAEPTTPDMLLLHLGDIQNTGFRHGFGPHVDTYMDAIESADRKLAEVIAALRARQSMHREEDWLVVITTDHGRDALNGKGHGGQSERERSTWIATNSGCLADRFYTTPAIVDIVPSILAHMHIQVPDTTRAALDGSSFLTC